MPNLANVTKPILIIGPGRSGSSWLVDILAQHPAVQPLVENSLVNSLFLELYESWWSTDWGWICDEAERDQRIVRALRGMFCELFPAAEPMWTMKILWRGQSWDFIHRLFPEARYLHIVRSPLTAIPSMMEFMGANNPAWREMDTVVDEYVQGNRDALAVRDQGRQYLMIRQEEAQQEPEKVWDQISEFLELDRAPFMELNRAVNLAASTRRLPSLARPSLPWTSLPPVVRRLCVNLGYLKPLDGGDVTLKPSAPAAPAASPKKALPAEPDLVEGLQRQVEEKNRVIDELRKKYSDLLNDYDNLRTGGRQAPAATPAPTLAAGQSDPPARIMAASTHDELGRPAESFDALQEMHLKIKVLANQEVPNPCVGFTVFNKNSGEELFGANSSDEYLDLPALAPGETLEVDFGFTQLMTVGLYGIKAYLTDNPLPYYQRCAPVDLAPDIATFRVHNSALKTVHHKFLNPVSISFSKE